MWKWEQHGNIWIFVNMPIITIEPDGKGLWQACCGGRPVSQIPAGENIDDVIRRTMDYYDARIEMEAVKDRWFEQMEGHVYRPQTITVSGLQDSRPTLPRLLQPVR